MTEWISVGAAIAKLHHLGQAKARSVLIERAMGGKLPSRAALFRRVIEYDPHGQHLARDLKFVQENPDIIAPYLPRVRTGIEQGETHDTMLDPSFFSPAFVQPASSTPNESIVEVDWRAGDFKRIEMIDYDRVTLEAVAVQFKASMIDALVHPVDAEAEIGRRRSGPKPTYPEQIAIVALLEYASMHGIEDKPGELARLTRAVQDAYAEYGMTPSDEAIRRRIKPWLDEVLRRNK